MYKRSTSSRYSSIDSVKWRSEQRKRNAIEESAYLQDQCTYSNVTSAPSKILFRQQLRQLDAEEYDDDNMDEERKEPSALKEFQHMHGKFRAQLNSIFDNTTSKDVPPPPHHHPTYIANKRHGTTSQNHYDNEIQRLQHQLKELANIRESGTLWKQIDEKLMQKANAALITNGIDEEIEDIIHECMEEVSEEGVGISLTDEELEVVDEVTKFFA